MSEQKQGWLKVLGGGIGGAILTVVVMAFAGMFSSGVSAGQYKEKVDNAVADIAVLKSLTTELAKTAITNATIIANHEKTMTDINSRLREHETEDRGKFKSLSRK